MTDFFNLLITRRADVVERLLEHISMKTMSVLISLFIGIPLGIIITKNKFLANIIIGIANLLQSIPCIALLAFSVPFVGIGEKPAILMVIIYALLPIIKNTYTGLKSIDSKTLESAYGIGLSSLEILFKIELPIAASFIMAGIRISAVAAVGTMTIAAFAGAGGLGWFINMGLIGLNINMVLLGAIPASILALLIDYILANLEAIITPEGLKPVEEINRLTKHQLFIKKIIICSISFMVFFIPLGINLNKYFEKDEKTIVVGTTNFTEAFTLGYIYSELIEKNTDIKVIKRFNLNGADFAFNALNSGKIDIFVEYTGTILANFLKKPIVSDPDIVYQTAYDGLLKNFDVFLSKPIGFNNTYVMSTTENTAKKYGLKNLSDLVNISNVLTLGCTSEFIQREDGLLGMEKKLGINFKTVKTLDATVRYQAVANDEVDVIDAFSTDALLKKLSLVPLKDDIGFFPPFYAVNLMKIDLFKKYPELKPLFSKLDGLINDEEMRTMNYMVDVEGKDSKDVAHEFLLKNNLIP